MRLPSLDLLLGEAARSARRFPFVLLMALAAALCAIFLVDGGEEEALVRGLLAAILGIPLLTALALLGERRGGKVALSLAGVALAVLYYFFMPDPESVTGVARFIQFILVAHLLVSFLPHLGRDEANGFWQFNKEIFLRLLGALIFTGVLVAGLNVALLALDKLFGLRIDGELYARIDLLLLFLFNTWYFLGGVPRDWAALERSAAYPRALKVFAQFILAPLVAVYLALLVAYLVKVIVTTQWPSGWIGWLVSSVAAAGLFSLALLHPRVKQRDSGWIATYARLYFVLMLPAVIMMLLAIGKRIAQYGITENRYFIVVLALWLLGVCGAGALNRLRGLKPLPLTLCLVALLSSFGPWGAYSVSRRSQTARLGDLLAETGCLVAGKLQAPGVDPGFESRREMSAKLDYLVEHHGAGTIEDWLSEEQASELAERFEGSRPTARGPIGSQLVMGFLDLEHVAGWTRSEGDRWRYVQRQPGEDLMDLTGYTQLLRITLPLHAQTPPHINGDPLEVAIAGESLRLRFAPGDSLVIPLERLLAELRDHLRHLGRQNAPDSLLTVEAVSDRRRARLLLDNLNWQEEESGARIDHLAGLLLLAPQPERDER